MTIVINALSIQMAASQKQVMQDLIRHYPAYKWVVLLGAHQKPPTGDIETEYFSKPLSNGLRNHIQSTSWVKRMIRKHTPSLVLTMGDRLIKTRIPQIGLYPSTVFFQEPDRLPVSYKRYHSIWYAAYYRSLREVIVVSQKEKEFLSRKFRITNPVVSPIPIDALATSGPLSYEDREEIKVQYVGGFEYFLCTGIAGDEPAVMNLLKAFSAFKKRQKSSMQLVLAGTGDMDTDALHAMLRLYKYRPDVRVLEEASPEVIQKLLSAAYAVVFIHPSDNQSNELFAALYAGVPSLVCEGTTLQEVGGEATEPYEAGNIPVLAGKMMLLFKDEGYRKRLVAKSADWLPPAGTAPGIIELGNLIEKYALGR